MPRLTIQQTNLTAGEISPRLLGRTDIDRYNNAAKGLTNAYAVVHGGAIRRPGTLYAAATKNSAKHSRLVGFVVARDVAYMLEFGDLYVRVYPKGGGLLIAELVSPYTEAMLSGIDFTQGADTMFLFHESVPIQRLRRVTSLPTFDLSPAPFSVTPFDEQGHIPAANVTLSAATVGTGRTATASASVFLPTDIGRHLISGAGLSTITAWASGTSITVDISIAFTSTSLPSGTWYMDLSPQAIVKPSAKDPVASVIDLFGAQTRAANLTLTAKTGAITITADAAVFTAGDTGKVLYADSGVVPLTFSSTTVLTGTTTSDFLSLTYPTGGWGITQDTWRTEDIGKFVRINGGLVQITSLTSAATAKAKIITALTGTVASPPLAWSLESSVWSTVNGYPRTGTLFEQRLVVGGSPAYPQTVWGSRTGDYLDFTKGSNDDDSYAFTLASDEVNPISYLAALRNLIAHTYGGEFSLQGGVEKPITPTNVRVRPESGYGSKGVRPLTVGKESIFVQRAGRKVRAIGYRYDNDGYVAPDLTVLAEHITSGGVVGMAYQQEPDSIVWLWRADGAMLSCTLDRDQSVIAWAKHYTDGAVESMATIPNGDKDETWSIVKRTVNAATVRYLEIANSDFAPILPGVAYTGFPPAPDTTIYGCTVDCGLSFDAALGMTTISLPHLVGKTVDIVADGAVQPQQVVPLGGTVTLARKSYRVLAGLHFRSEIALLTPEVGTGTGTAQGNSMRTSEVTMRFLNTIGARLFDGEGVEQIVPFRQFGPVVLDAPPDPFTGLVKISTLGWSRGKSELTAIQDQPLPMHLLSVIRKFTVNDG